MIPHAYTGLPYIECATLAGFSILYTPPIVADEGLLSGHVGLLGDQHPVVILEVIVDLSPREHVIGGLQVF